MYFPFVYIATFRDPQTLNYCFVAGSFQGTHTQQQKVADIIVEWERYANITFNRVDGPNAEIRITFDPDGGSNAVPGTTVINSDDPLKPTMNLSRIKSGSPKKIADLERGYILHEFGHVLGFYHEHQSPFFEKQISMKSE